MQRPLSIWCFRGCGSCATGSLGSYHCCCWLSATTAGSAELLANCLLLAMGIMGNAAMLCTKCNASNVVKWLIMVTACFCQALCCTTQSRGLSARALQDAMRCLMLCSLIQLPGSGYYSSDAAVCCESITAVLAKPLSWCVLQLPSMFCCFSASGWQRCLQQQAREGLLVHGKQL